MDATEQMINSPFPGSAVPEIPLPDAPLVRVLTQLRYSTIASLTQMEFIAPFQEALRSGYPTMEEQREVRLAFGPDGVTQSTGDRQWKLSSRDGTWTVNLTPSFTSLETTAYESRGDFVSRLGEVVAALNALVGDLSVDRLGVRYTDRLVGARASSELNRLVREEALGPARLELDGVELLASVNETEFALNDGTRMTARWGVLPPGATLTPDVPPLQERSWVLDLDAAVSNVRLSREIIEEAADRLCNHAYGFFRWVITDEFIRVHGGEVE